MSPADTRALRPHIRARAQGRCEYCHLPEEADFAQYEIDHIIAEQHGGQTALENLAYACFDCNKHKGPNISPFAPSDSNCLNFKLPIESSPQAQPLEDVFL